MIPSTPLHTVLRTRDATSACFGILKAPMNGRGWKWHRDVAQNAASFLVREGNDTPQECARWTPVLTALFDGEASESQAREARRHLLSCERCAQTWLGWNQTRALLLDQMAPAPPQKLLYRIRVACRLANQRQTPDLHAQILARTSRAAQSKPAPHLRLLLPQLSPSLWSATALAALVLFLARDSFLPIQPGAPAFDSTPTFESAPQQEARHASQHEAPLPILASDPALSKPKSATKSAIAYSVVVAKRRESASSGAARTLALAEREPLGSSAPLAPLPVLASLPQQPSAPLPVLASLPLEAENVAVVEPLSPAKSRRARPSVRTRRITARKMSSRLRASHLVASRPIVLALAPVPATVESDLTDSLSVAAPLPSERRSHLLLAAVPRERAPLRISAPRVRPVTFSRDDAPDDAGLEDLDSTVEEYRSALASESSD